MFFIRDYQENYHNLSYDETEFRCQFCDSKEIIAAWSIKREGYQVQICAECANDRLPGLIADAIMAVSINMKRDMICKDLQRIGKDIPLSDLFQDGLELLNIQILERFNEKIEEANRTIDYYENVHKRVIHFAKSIDKKRKHVAPTNKSKTKLAESIYKYREANKLTQTQFAKYVGLKNSQIVSRLEKGTYDFLKVRTRMRLREKGFPI